MADYTLSQSVFVIVRKGIRAPRCLVPVRVVPVRDASRRRHLVGVVVSVSRRVLGQAVAHGVVGVGDVGRAQGVVDQRQAVEGVVGVVGPDGSLRNSSAALRNPPGSRTWNRLQLARDAGYVSACSATTHGSPRGT